MATDRLTAAGTPGASGTREAGGGVAGLDLAGLSGPGLHPPPASPATGAEQWFGAVWQWTASAYVAYPGFEEIRTEISAKFTPDGVRAELAAAGMEVTGRWTDPAGDYLLTLARPAAPNARGASGIGTPHRSTTPQPLAAVRYRVGRVS